ncbi:jg21795 [Pararge aegeria aegeria]|uniref:Jg21795 protein n=1 Tax=Pararge aegeria aegeria TaxID=348720 RepID=A0A8S4S2M9_9NEOP|nr:jg21795 [Pararge aegeria aegeria]
MAGEATCFATTGSASQLFASAINILTAAQCLVPDMKSAYGTLPDQDHFDMIIVGGGTAGSVVANRLSEIEEWNVLVLEAGPEPPIESDIPNLEGALYRSKYDWQYGTKNDGITLQGLRDGSVQWPRGKMLGGGSSMNAMYYVRGNDHDFQTWYAEGNPSWSPENVNSYFRKAENFQDMELNKDPKIYETYGHDGPLVINTFNSSYADTIQKVLDSWDHIGVKQVPDINAAKFEGRGLCSFSRATAANGVRQSTYRAYLNPANKRQNLKIVTNAFVTKILINDDAQAYGVEVDINGEQKTFYADIEVIVSAGAINSAQILMLSGIGPKEHLASQDISCKVNLPVGQNLQDHPYVPIPICGNKPGRDNEDEKMFEVLRYFHDKTGYLQQGSITNMAAFFSRCENMTYPEYQCHLVMFPQNSTTARPYLNTFENNVADSITQCHSHNALYILALHLLHPFSRGNISLISSDPYVYPDIYANYLSDERDLQASADGIMIASTLVDTPYFKSINAFIPKVDLPQCDEYEFLSELYWKCYSKHMTQTVFHPLSTAKMGPDPKDSVVNNILKVYGVGGLRVVDGSIMPYETSGNTNAPIIMIGEMASDMIKDEYLSKPIDDTASA